MARKTTSSSSRTPRRRGAATKIRGAADSGPLDIILPPGARALLSKAPVAKRHPGLQLDKLSPPGDQEHQKAAISDVCLSQGDSHALHELFARRTSMLTQLGAVHFRATTAGPLTLHLARASGLENAGLHLHPVYGFACLPASGLKGMARSYAETVWLRGQDDETEAWNCIRTVFGSTPYTDRGKSWLPEGVALPESSQAGAVNFHDAWPTAWPPLQLDITNNHHPKYYDGDDVPGDWESPIPVYFLVIGADVTFDFPVSARLGANKELLECANGWLRAALVHEGAGAKTSSGYGRFRLEEPSVATPPERARRSVRYEIKLAAPAFLAGARQNQDDCDLRPATLRGLLRWWWRTMHAGHLNRDDLRTLEATIWGDNKRGAALAVSVAAGRQITTNLFDKNAMGQSEDSSMSGGLRYVSYGMDETSQGKPAQRFYVDEGACWTVCMTARATRTTGGVAIESEHVLRQGEVALWLLCRYGGVGSKARKGFGSWCDIHVGGIAGVDDCKNAARALRDSCRLPPGECTNSPQLEKSISIEVPTPWSNPWDALSRLGATYQGVVKSFPKQRRALFGLPGRTTKHGPDRHAAPLHWSLSQGPEGLTIRLIAFLSHGIRVPDSGDSLATAVEQARRALEAAAKQPARTGRSQPKSRGSQMRRHASRTRRGGHGDEQTIPRAKDTVQAVLVERKTKKGGWMARHEPSGLEGPIQNSTVVPRDAEPGQRTTLLVAYANPSQIAFRWPLP